jgi:cobalt/nickel transport system ATP-binding protein
MNGEDLKRMEEEWEIDLVGVMGTRSRAFADSCGITADISSNVIDRTILRALCGEVVLILTNGGMVEHTRRRIEDYCRQSGMRIKVFVLDGKREVKAGSTEPAYSCQGKVA